MRYMYKFQGNQAEFNKFYVENNNYNFVTMYFWEFISNEI